MRKAISIAAVFGALLATPLAIHAQGAGQGAADYPARPVKIVVPFSPGGATDLVARQVGQKLHEAWSQPVVIENRAGAGGNIGAQAVARAPADGYMLFLGSMGPLVINQFLRKDLPFDPAKDFLPITSLVNVNNVLVVSNDLPARDVRELIAYGKANPGRLNYASSGIGATDHLAAELFKDMTQIDMQHIPFKGGVAAITSLIAGDTPISFATAPTVLSHIQAGKIRALGVTGSQRLAQLPDTPTVAEAGVEGFDVSTWFGLFAPAGTPAAIIEKLNRDVVKVLANPEIIEALRTGGLETAPTSAAEFADRIKRDTEKWSALIQKVGISAQ